MTSNFEKDKVLLPNVIACGHYLTPDYDRHRGVKILQAEIQAYGEQEFEAGQIEGYEHGRLDERIDKSPGMFIFGLFAGIAIATAVFVFL